MSEGRNFNLVQGARKISDLLNECSKGFPTPELSFNPSDYDLTGSSEIVQALKDEKEENILLNKKNTRLTYLSIFLAAVPILFGLWSLFQTQKAMSLWKGNWTRCKFSLNVLLPEKIYTQSSALYRGTINIVQVQKEKLIAIKL